MEIEKTEVIYKDEESGLVLKKTTTSEGEFLNRKLAVPNTIYNCEKKRVKLNQSIIESPFQTHHLEWDKSNEEWIFTGLKKAKKHAEENSRIFLPFPQRNQTQWESLSWEESMEDLKEFSSKTKIVPFAIPLEATLEELNFYKKEAKKHVLESQSLMTLISSKHNPENFPLIFNNELKESDFLGISCFQMVHPIEKMNLNIAKSINSKLNVGDKCALLTYFNYERVMSKHMQVAGSFAFSFFGGDILSQRAYFKFISEPTPDDLYFYDTLEKKFTKSMAQKQRYGFDLSNNVTNLVPVSSGLDYTQALKFASHKLQQDDLNKINKILIEKSPVLDKLKDYTGWAVFLETAISSQN